FALFGAFALGYSDRKGGFNTRFNAILLGVVALVIAFSLQFALYRVLERIPDTLQDDRPTIARTTLDAAIAFMPLGSGFGTFVPAYALFERPEHVQDTYVNHAHNDALEVWLEGGIVGLASIALFTFLLVRRAVVVWRSRPPRGASLLDWTLVRGSTM